MNDLAKIAHGPRSWEVGQTSPATIKTMKTAALIPCRTGSKGIPDKNFREIAGRSLWEWTFLAASESDVFDMILLSTDGGPITNWAGNHIVVDTQRPPELATDDASLDDVLEHYRKEYKEIEMWCLLQPTSPLRTAGDIKRAYRKAKAEKYDSLVSVTADPMMYWVENATSAGHVATYHVHKRPNRQQRKSFYRENGAIYFTKNYVLETMGLRLGGTIGLYKMPKIRSFEVDDETDWAICEFLLNGNSKRLARKE